MKGIYPHRPKYNITKEYLAREYTHNNRTQAEIAIECGCGSTLIYNLLKKYDIPAHSRSSLLKGRKFSLEHREKLAMVDRSYFKGDKNPKWKGGVSFNHNSIRRQARYNSFRNRVLRFKGDICEQCGKNLNEFCQCCGQKPDKHVHHIKTFSDNPDERFSISNALVLCHPCHIRQHKK